MITGDGVLGQVFRIGPFSSEIILITDAEHALPVQVLRSGVRTIALGTGRSTALELPYVPQNYDVKVGDVLVTSGLGRVFPVRPARGARHEGGARSRAAAGADPRRAARAASNPIAKCCSSGARPGHPGRRPAIARKRARASKPAPAQAPAGEAQP